MDPRFGKQSAKKMVAWTQEHCPPSSSPSILDLGCGNGHFLFLLASARGGYKGSILLGVDYSQSSVELAKMIGKARASGEARTDSEASEDEDDEEAGEGSEGDVRFEQGDILVGDDLPGGPWDLV